MKVTYMEDRKVVTKEIPTPVDMTIMEPAWLKKN